MIQYETPLLFQNGILLPLRCSRGYDVGSPSSKSRAAPPRFIRKTLKQTMAIQSLAKLPRLLMIPLELREQIYEELLHDQPATLFNLLSVNHEISVEVRPWLFRQPLTFNGQQSLFGWLSRVDPKLLGYVEDIRLRMHDIDPEKIVGALGERLRRARSRDHTSIGSPYQEACYEEACRVGCALEQLSKLKSFTLLPTMGPDPQPPSGMLYAVTHQVVKQIPLVSISIPHSVLPRLDRRYVGQIQYLQVLEYSVLDDMYFQGENFPAYLDAFSNLRSLSIFHRHAVPEECFAKERLFPNVASLTNNLPQLQELTLCLHGTGSAFSEVGQKVSDAAEHNNAVKRTHAGSLKSLRFHCNGWSIHGSLSTQRLLHFLCPSALTHMETNYSCTPAPDQYPASVVTIAVIFDKSPRQCYGWTKKFYNHLQLKEPAFFEKHPCLQAILLYLPSADYGKSDTCSGDIFWAYKKEIMAKCNKNGVRLQVIYKDFSCKHQH
ncbi:MAG: hypothetical protein Q9222_006311 [Ikaeria aurantiellina]